LRFTFHALRFTSHVNDLNDLYREIVMEHNWKPRNFRKLEGATHQGEGFNPLCGDKITLYLDSAGGVIDDIGFEGSGCAISRASASMMTEALKGKTAAEARQIFDAFRQMLTNPGEEYDADTLGDLEVLSGVSEFPIRIKCATLAWHTLKATLDGEKKAVATE
jgi:nitrogen fixation NifU-like protein